MMTRALITRVLMDVAVLMGLVFIGLLILTISRVHYICRNAPQVCGAVVIVPQQGPPK